MPRSARRKHPTAIYHAMCRSISEFTLFQSDDDKEYFLNLLQRYKEKFKCKIYAYCLMDNHYHIHLDTCGFDISKFMQAVNLAYVRYVNIKYKRRGPLFADRFNSKIITDDRYNLTVSAYIHNNVKDLPGYEGKEFQYPYSSMGIYLGIRKDYRNLIDTNFVLGSLDENNRKRAVTAYVDMVKQKLEVGIDMKLKAYLEEFSKEQYTYKSYREIILRDKKPEEVINFIARRFGMSETKGMMDKWKRSATGFRSAVSYALTTFCGLGYTDVCKRMNNITASCCARLSRKGCEAFGGSDIFKEMLLELG